MSRVLTAATIGLLCTAWAMAVPAPKGTSIVHIDLQKKANQKLDEDLHGKDNPQNFLGELPRGKQTLEGVKFEIGEKLLQLGSKNLKDFPEKIEGIKVGRFVTKLHFLHGTGHWADPDAVIGKYLVVYADKSTDEIEIAYGKDVHDWWTYPNTKEVTRGKVAWKGKNQAATKAGATLQLFLLTWKNPHPKKKVDHIDFVSTMTNCEPFCVAITAEAR